MWKAFWRVRAPQRGCSPQFIKTWSCEAPGTRQLQKGVLLGMVDFSGLDAFSIATSQKSSWMSCDWRFLTFMPWLQHFSAVWNGEGRRVATGGVRNKSLGCVTCIQGGSDGQGSRPRTDCRKYLLFEFAGHHAQESEPFWSVSWVKTKLVVFFTSFLNPQPFQSAVSYARQTYVPGIPKQAVFNGCLSIGWWTQHLYTWEM